MQHFWLLEDEIFLGVTIALPKILWGHFWLPNGVKVTLDPRFGINKQLRKSVQKFRPLGSLEEHILLWVSRTSSKESWRTFLILELSLDNYRCQKWHVWKLKKHSIRYQAPCCTGSGYSPQSLQHVLHGVLEDILDSWMESKWLWTPGLTCINAKEALCKISGL